MSRIAFFSIPAHGHTNPTVEVVRTLVARGHRVRYYSFEEFRGRLEGAGAEFVPCDSYLPPAPRDVERRIGRDFASLIGMVVDVTAAMEERVLGELAAFRPHCIVADSLCIWGKLYAERLGIPLVCSTTTFAFDQETARGMRPRPGELLRTLAGVPRIGKKLALLRAHGYRAEKLTDLIQNDSSTYTIVYTSRAFQPGGERFGERVAFVGPVLPELPAPAERGNRPLIYVSLGTVMNRNARFYRNCAEALGGGPWDVLMSVGSGERAASLGALPPNVRAEARVDQLRVLQAAHLFVTHCGMNSANEAIFCQVPTILFPQQGEEAAVADIAVRYVSIILPFSWCYAVLNCIICFNNGMGQVRFPTIVNILMLWAVRIPSAYLIARFVDGGFIMASVSISFVFGMSCMLTYYLGRQWKDICRRAALS